MNYKNILSAILVTIFMQPVWAVDIVCRGGENGLVVMKAKITDDYLNGKKPYVVKLSLMNLDSEVCCLNDDLIEGVESEIMYTKMTDKFLHEKLSSNSVLKIRLNSKYQIGNGKNIEIYLKLFDASGANADYEQEEEGGYIFGIINGGADARKLVCRTYIQ